MKCTDIKDADYIESRRSPCGERGLKFDAPAEFACFLLSLPVRGAWIEIKIASWRIQTAVVAPRAGSVD